jgi:Fe-S-cluster containining protein
MDKLERFLDEVTFPGVKELKDIYARYDEDFRATQRKHGFGCLEGCGACCHTPSHKIEVTVFEMLPMALDLLQQGRAEEMMEQLNKIDTSESVCLQYHASSADGKQGYCTLHGPRPLICRLFAGGTRINKRGEPVIVLCRPLKDRYLGREQLLGELAEELPIITDFATTAREHNPSLSAHFYPINEGLKRALDMVLSRWDYFEQ